MATQSLTRLYSILATLTAIIALLLLAPATLANDSPATNSASTLQNGALLVHVTAVQGGTQYRLPGETKWQALTGGLDLAEGVEFRTGPRGAIQFTVGSDQVYRVDRLTVVKVLRASLTPDGQIKTDVGMTYGRVSKDVDQPARPHDDVIVSPAATLAVRGTHVSLYDQPPYLPEAVSLTGLAAYRYRQSLAVFFGKKHEGTAKVGGDSDSSAHYQMSFLPVDPQGDFDGITPPELSQIADGDTLQGSIGQLVDHESSIIGGQLITDSLIGTGNPNTTAGELSFGLSWSANSGSAKDTVVTFTVTSPLGELISPTMPGPVPSGGFYAAGSSTVANSAGMGTQTIQWGTSYAAPGASFPNGVYTVTETLNGTLTQTLSQAPTTAVTANLFAIKYSTTGSFTLTNIGSGTLNASTPSETFQVNVPSLTAPSPGTQTQSAARAITQVSSRR